MEQPKWDEYMLGELEHLSDGKEHKRNDIINAVANDLGITEEMKAEVISSGGPLYLSRGSWGLTYLKQSGLVETPVKGVYVITDSGKKTLQKKPKSFLQKDLEQFPKYQEFLGRSRGKKKSGQQNESLKNNELSPDEMITQAEDQIKNLVCSQLLDRVRKMDPYGFEKLVIDVLFALGYGNGSKDSGIHTGKTGDGGIDGVINQDKLGLDTIYIQAKRYSEKNIVTPHDVRDFVGALQGKESKGARKGVFITTSDFTKEGREYVEGIKDGKVILINGHQLVELMYDNNIGVSIKNTIITKKFDSDYFEE